LKSTYVTPAGKRAKYSHYPRFAWIAWVDGQPRKMQVRFLCGGYSWTARGSDTTEFPVCVKCRLVVTGPEAVASCLDRVEPTIRPRRGDLEAAIRPHSFRPSGEFAGPARVEICDLCGLAQRGPGTMHPEGP
jgi:hypothetical protein